MKTVFLYKFIFLIIKGVENLGLPSQLVFPGKNLSAFFQNVWSHPGRKRQIYSITEGMSRVRTTAHSHLRRAQQGISPCFWKTPIRIEFTLLKTSGKSVDISHIWNGSIGSTRRFFMPSSTWSWRKIYHEMDRCIPFMNIRKFQSSCVLFLYFFDGFPNPIQNGHFEGAWTFSYSIWEVMMLPDPATGRSLVCHWKSLLPWWRDLVKSYW